MTGRAALLALALLAACRSDAPPPTTGAETADPALAADCADRGGTLVFGKAGPACAMPQPDAGQACTGSADCQGFCLADSRTCSPVTPFFGCHDLYEEGQPGVAICID